MAETEGRHQCRICCQTSAAPLVRCEGCDAACHRSCLGLERTAYSGGWFVCPACVLSAAGVAARGSGTAAWRLAGMHVGLLGSAVASSSAETYLSHRRRFSRFCEEQLGLSESEVFPRDRSEDLNPMVACLFVTYAASRYAASTVEGTLSALADWQRSRGVRAGNTVSHHARVKATLARALRTRSPAHTEGSGVKAPLTLALLRLLIGWLATRAGPKPEVALRYVCDACWLAIGFFVCCDARSCSR